jgi:hypothetical protein
MCRYLERRKKAKGVSVRAMDTVPRGSSSAVTSQVAVLPVKITGSEVPLGSKRLPLDCRQPKLKGGMGLNQDLRVDKLISLNFEKPIRQAPHARGHCGFRGRTDLR